MELLVAPLTTVLTRSNAIPTQIQKFHRIILENSGVAEPQNIRDQFSDAIMEGHPLMSRIHLDSLVTLVDSGTFIKEYSSRAPLVSRPDLGEGGGLRPVVDLLVEQIECADYVVLNKTDLLDEATTGSLSAIVSSLNPLAQVVTCQHGAVPCEKLFGSEAQALVALLNTEGQHRGAVAAARTAHEAALREEREEKERKEREEKEAHGHGKESNGHAHAHDHAGHDHAGHDHDAPGHKHDSHDSHKQNGHAHDGHKHHDHGEHKHEAQNGHKHHDHDHDHDHDHAHHDHAHHDHEHHDHDSHDHSSHDHDASHPHKHHKHSHDRKETTAAKRFGITSFVYSRRRPFHPQRLKDLVLKWMPVSHNKTLEGAERAEDGASPIKAVLRSKGFMWVANSHTTAFYWSHAGQYFEIRDEGEWWAAVPDDMWPEVAAQRAIILADFDASAGFGDRRQEIVFIGAGMDEKAISAQLDSALLTDEGERRGGSGGIAEGLLLSTCFASSKRAGTRQCVLEFAPRFDILDNNFNNQIFTTLYLQRWRTTRPTLMSPTRSTSASPRGLEALEKKPIKRPYASKYCAFTASMCIPRSHRLLGGRF